MVFSGKLQGKGKLCSTLVLVITSLLVGLYL